MTAMPAINNQQLYSILYDMALASSGETQVRPLLTKTLQRLLYHTGFPCGLYLHILDNSESKNTQLACEIELSICHDSSLPQQGEQILVDEQLLTGPLELIQADNILNSSETYQAVLRVPVRRDGVFLLLSKQSTGRELPFRQLFEPVMANFSKNLRLCRDNENHTQQLVITLESLRQSEANHKDAQRLGKIGHWILNSQTGELSWSDEIYNIFGRKRDEFAPTLDNFYSSIYPDDLPQVKSAVESSSLTGSYKIEHRIILPDNTIRWVQEQARVVTDDQKQLVQMVGTVQDISEQKQAAAEKELLMRQLQQSQKMESIGHLTGGIAHDFNNILAAMLGFAELLHELIPEGDDSDVLLGYVDEIITGGERARDLVAQMLAFSRGQSGTPQDINPVPVINETIKLLSAMIPSSIRIQTIFEKEDGIISIDPVQLHQLVMNLVINARDAMHGKGKITLGLREKEVKGVCNSCHENFNNQFMEVYVRDTGTGIKADVLNRIFDPFYSSKEIGKGTGMGLSVVHGIVHDSDGHILVETSPDKGTYISLLFPRRESVQNTKAQPVSKARNIA